MTQEHPEVVPQVAAAPASVTPASVIKPVSSPVPATTHSTVAVFDTQEPDGEETRVELEPEILQFVLTDWYRKAGESLKERFTLSVDDAVFIGDMSRMVMAGAVPLDEALDLVADEFKEKVSGADRDKLFAQLLADRFVPLGDAIKPTAIEVARKLNLKLPVAPYYRVYVKPLTYTGAATEIAAACGFSLMSGQLRERMREIVMNKVTGVSVDAQVKETLMRPQEFDGLGLDAKAADRAIVVMKDLLSRATIMSEDEFSKSVGAGSPRPRSVAGMGAETAPLRTSPEMAEDEQEIAAIKSKMPEQAASALDKAVDETLTRLSYTAPDEYLAKRIRNIISSRLRDVRTADDIRQLLTRDTKVGGVGLASADAQRVAADIESGYADFHGAVAAEEKGKLDAQLEEQKQKVTERRRLDAAQHAKWYEEKIRSRKAQETVSASAFGAMRGAPPAPTPLEAKEKRVEATKYGPLVPAASSDPRRGGVTPPSVGRGDGRGDRAPTGSLARPGVKISPQTVVIDQKKASERPTLDAMSYAGPKLMGLMGELRTIDVAEFRRFSKDPREAGKKIRSLLETLGQESFERRMEGITTFRSSPLQGAYLALIAESFKTGRPVSQVAEEKRKLGENVLSPEEIAAVMELNSALQY